MVFVIFGLLTIGIIALTHQQDAGVSREVVRKDIERKYSVDRVGYAILVRHSSNNLSKDSIVSPYDMYTFVNEDKANVVFTNKDVCVIKYKSESMYGGTYQSRKQYISEKDWGIIKGSNNVFSSKAEAIRNVDGAIQRMTEMYSPSHNNILHFKRFLDDNKDVIEQEINNNRNSIEDFKKSIVVPNSHGTYHVYKVSVGDKVYHGYTARPVQERIAEHLEAANNNTRSVFYSALRSNNMEYKLEQTWSFDNMFDALKCENDKIKFTKSKLTLNHEHGGRAGDTSLVNVKGKLMLIRTNNNLEVNSMFFSKPITVSANNMFGKKKSFSNGVNNSTVYVNHNFVNLMKLIITYYKTGELSEEWVYGVDKNQQHKLFKNYK